MDSLSRTEDVIRVSILFHIDEEEIAKYIKVVTTILVTAHYKEFLSATCHHITSAIEYKKNIIYLLNLDEILKNNFVNKTANTKIDLLSVENRKAAIMVENLKEPTKKEIFSCLS